MKVVTAIGFEEEEKQAMEKVIDMLTNIGEPALLDRYIVAKGELVCLNDIRTSLKALLRLHKKD
jgi:hypothetical protein